VARVGELGGQPARLTVDRPIRCILTDGLSLAEATDGLSLFDGEAILELKFPWALPVAFKDLLRELSISPGPVSKYRLGLQACGLRGSLFDPPAVVVTKATVAPRLLEGGLRPAPAP
jgi:hypothetical protein